MNNKINTLYTDLFIYYIVLSYIYLYVLNGSISWYFMLGIPLIYIFSGLLLAKIFKTLFKKHFKEINVV